MSATLLFSNTSLSKLLRISLLNERCSLKCSDDCAALFVDPPDNTFVSTIDLCMKDNDGKEISAVSFSMGCTSGQQRIRTDGLFSIIFDAWESIAVLPEWVSDHYSTETMVDKCGRFEMTVNIHLLDVPYISFFSRTTPFPIHSGVLKVADSTLPISKEILALTSPFFYALFYGSFSVVQKDIFEIKEVNEDYFIWFINSILRRNWTFTSVEQALVALTYADRFEMLYLHKCALPYLLKNSLPQDDIKDTLLLCDRFKQNEELITRADLVIECAPEMQKCSIIAAHKVLKELVTEAQKLASVLKAVFNSLMAPICLRFYDENGMVERETYFTQKLDSNGDLWCSTMWPSIPQEYKKIEVEGYTVHRGKRQVIVMSPPRMIDIHAYRR